VNDTTLETIKINRYDRDFLRPMIVKNKKRQSLSVTIDSKVNKLQSLLDMETGLGNAARLNERLHHICNDDQLCGILQERPEIIEELKESEPTTTKQYLTAKNVHPISLMLVEIDQLSSRINLDNRQSDQRKHTTIHKYEEERFNEELIMLKMAKVLDSVGKNFNAYLVSTASQNGSDRVSLLDISDHESIYTSRISLDGQGQKKVSIKSEAFRYAHNIFALLLHNTDVAKSLLISRFIQKEIIDLCAKTTEFRYDEHYLTASIAIANLHYNAAQTEIIDSYRSWYKRCSDALKTIRFEGGNGITHADILFGVQTPPASHAPKDERPSMGIVHTAGSNPSEPGIGLQFQHSLELRKSLFSAFNDNAHIDISPELHEQKTPHLQPSNLALSPQLQSVGSPTITLVEPSPNT